MLLRFFLIIVCISAMSVNAQDDWLGTDLAGGHFGIRYADYEEAGNSFGLNMTLPAFSQSEFHLATSEYREEQTDTTHYSQSWQVYWNSDPYAAASFGLGARTSGKKSELEIRDFALHAQYLTESFWRFRGELVIGEAEISDESISAIVADEFRRLGLHHIDRKGINLSIAYDGMAWGARVGFAVYHHDASGNASAAELLALDQQIDDESSALIRYYLGLAYYAFRQQCINQGEARDALNTCVEGLFTDNAQVIRDGIAQWEAAFIDFNRADSQKDLLSDHEISADIYWLLGHSTLGLGVFSYESYIEEKTFTQSYAEWRYNISDHTTVGLLLGYSDNDSQTWSEVSVGWSW